MSVSNNKTTLSSELISDLLSEISIKENVINPIYKISGEGAKGDGYTSFITKVDIKGKNKTLPVVIKNCAKISASAESFPIQILFLQEIKYYQEILPALKSFQINKGIKNVFRSAPVCYKTVNSDQEEKLVLENITKKGFKVFDKKIQMDDSHVELVLKTYGHFHGISYALKDQEPEKFFKLTDGIINPFSTAYVGKEFFEIFLEGMEKIKLQFENKQPEVYKKMSILKDKLMPFFKDAVKYDGKYGVLSHGDCWCNNMMFKYQDNNPNFPTDMCLFDFQLGSLMTPVCDLSYFFYASASAQMLDNLDHYLKIYHDSLRKHMQEMGSDVDKIYPFSALKEEWKKYSKFGIYISSCIYRMMLRDEDEVVDLTDNMSPKDTFMNKSKWDHLINERYRLIGLHFYKNNFI